MKPQEKPRYQQLKEMIIGRIMSGELQPRDRVPSENELVDAMKVSRMTANRALRELTDEGYVDRVAGRGFSWRHSNETPGKAALSTTQRNDHRPHHVGRAAAA